MRSAAGVVVAGVLAAAFLLASSKAQAQGIDVRIVAGPTKESSSVHASGYIKTIVSNSDRSAFKIGDNNLKNAIKHYFGRRPNSAYVRSSTPWGDLYRRYHWAQVRRVLRVQRAWIVSITSKPTILSQKTFTNDSKVTATFNAGITENVTNTVSNSWSTTNSITVKQEFKYGVSMLGTGAEGKTSFAFSHSWGQTTSKSSKTTLGSSSGVKVTLKPGQSVVARLSASRGELKIRIVFETFLTGTTAVNYNPTFKGHHFWDLSIGGVMRSGNLSNSLKIIEDISVGYYTNGHITLSDK